MPFDLGLWCLTGVVLVAGSVLLAFSYRKSREMGTEHDVGPVLHRIQDAFLITYGAMLQQGNRQMLIQGSRDVWVVTPCSLVRSSYEVTCSVIGLTFYLFIYR
jgi:hypothetical protein